MPAARHRSGAAEVRGVGGGAHFCVVLCTFEDRPSFMTRNLLNANTRDIYSRTRIGYVLPAKSALVLNVGR